MVHTPLFVTAVLVIVAFASSSAHAQDYLSGSGIPTFVSPQPVEQGFVDASNGNLHLQFTFGSYPQRGSGQPYSVNYVYDSDMLWNIGCSGSSCSWAPSNYNNYGWRLGTNGGTLTGLNCTTSCEEWVFTDPLGTTHYFPVSTGSCPIPNAYASDSSGYMLNLCQTGVYAPDGTLVYSATYEQPVSPGAEDSNGNYISWGTGGLGGSTDTAGRAVPSLAISNCNGNAAETCYQVPNAQGATSTYTITTATIPVQTDFQQSGVSEFSGTITVVQSITQPDGTAYTFKYDCDSGTGNAACGSPSNQVAYYGVLTSMTLPTGGTVSYSYTTFSDSYSNKTEWLYSRYSQNGNWSYVPQVVSSCSATQVGCQQKVTVTQPNGEHTVTTFTLNNGAWPVEIQAYDASSNLLSTTTNTFDFSQSCPFTNCHGNAYIRLLATQTAVPAPSGNLTKQTEYQYDSPQTGNITAKEEWGYYPGGFPSVPDRATYTQYLTTGTNNIDKPSSVTLCNNSGGSSACPGGGSVVQQTLYTYDNYGSCPGGTIVGIGGIQNHDDTDFGAGYTTRGNVTQIQQWVSGSTYLTTQMCYDTTGQMVRQTDPYGNTTTFAYSDRFYNDNGTNSLSGFTPNNPTNAYLTSVTQPIIGATTLGYYYGSGQQAFTTDPNGATSYSHFMDVFDRATENDYDLVGWDKTAYTSPTQTDTYLAVGDTSPSTGCQSCEHKELVMDSWGRTTSEKMVNDPIGTVSVDTSYDPNGQVQTVSHPYQGSSGQVYETYSYDGLDRTTAVTHPDGEAVTTLYGTAVAGNGGGLTMQQGSTGTYGYGYPVLHRDEAGQERQEWIDGFGRIIEVDEPTTSGGTYGTGSATIEGTEQNYQIYTCQIATGGSHVIPQSCYRTIWDSGTISITVGGFVASTSYGEDSTDANIASTLASQFNGNSNSPVTVVLSGSTLNFTSKATGAASNYSLSTNSTTRYPGDPEYFSPSFWATLSGATLTGGTNSSPNLQNPAVTLYTYDAADHVTQVVQGIQTRTFAYDGMGRPISITTPEAGTATLAYTNSGSLCSGDPKNVCQRTDARSVVTSYYYDALNRLIGKSYTIPQGSSVAAMPNVCTTSMGQSANVCFNYDQGGAAAYALGRRTQMIDPSGSESYTYDAAGRTTQTQKVIGTQIYTTGYQYNADDELTQLTYPSGRVVQLSYNAIGEICEVAPQTNGCGSSSSPYSTAYSYNAGEQLTAFHYGNGVAGSLGYSGARSQLTGLSYASGSNTIFSLGYWYQQDSNNCPNGNSVGNNGQIQCISDSADLGRTVGYTYDVLGRLSTAETNGDSNFPQWGLAWTYDQYGNRLSQTVTAGSGYTSTPTFSNPGGAQTNQPDGWCFDASGNLLGKSGPCPPAGALVYDGENRMVSDPAAGTGYLYDGTGTRVAKCEPDCSSLSSSTAYIYADSQNIAEYQNGTGAGSPAAEFVYSAAVPGSGLLASIISGATTYFQDDQLSWRVSTNGSGQVLGQQGTYPFGDSWYSSNGNEFVFTSYQRDSESGFDYAMARYYDSSVARFCSADPVGGSLDDPQTWDRYTYVRNDPVDLTDPSGKAWWNWLIDIGIGVGAVLAPELAPAWFEAADASATVGTTQALVFSTSGEFLGASAGAVYTWGSASLATEAVAGGLAGAEFKVANASTEGPQQDTINNRLKDLQQRLPKDKPCNDFLNSQGVNAQQFLNDAMKYNAIGHADITENEDPFSDAAVSNGLVPGQVTTINNQGAFFHPTTTAGAPMTIGPRGFAGGSPRAQAAIMLHELGHLTHVLRPDAGNMKAVRANDKDINTHCAATINGTR
ncbi:MAG: RHS repeat-associated core domain-containing protein [Acidobacteriaceae bacterium]